MHVDGVLEILRGKLFTKSDRGKVMLKFINSVHFALEQTTLFS